MSESIMSTAIFFLYFVVPIVVVLAGILWSKISDASVNAESLARREAANERQLDREHDARMEELKLQQIKAQRGGPS